MTTMYPINGSVAHFRERRNARRFKLSLGCRVCSPYGRGIVAAGTTSDMSRSGILVRLEDTSIPAELSEVGGPARVLVELPPSPNLAPRCLECMTEITRVTETEPGNWSVSFRIHRTRIVDREESMPAERVC